MTHRVIRYNLIYKLNRFQKTTRRHHEIPPWVDPELQDSLNYLEKYLEFIKADKC